MDAIKEVKNFIEELSKENPVNVGNVLTKYYPNSDYIEISNDAFPKCKLKVLKDVWENGEGKAILKKEHDSHWLDQGHFLKHL